MVGEKEVLKTLTKPKNFRWKGSIVYNNYWWKIKFKPDRPICALTPGVNPYFVSCVPPGVCPECYTANGEDYRGVQNRTSVTESGKACLYWNETFQHPYNTVKYPNGEGGLGPHNYCRWVQGLEWERNWGPTAVGSLTSFIYI